jgi:hypothetical protein
MWGVKSQGTEWVFVSGRLLSEVNIWTPDLTRDLNLGICWMTEPNMAAPRFNYAPQTF